MSGLMGGGAPPPPPPPPPLPVDNSESEAAAERERSRNRKARGLAGTILTSKNNKVEGSTVQKGTNTVLG